VGERTGTATDGAGETTVATGQDMPQPPCCIGKFLEGSPILPFHSRFGECDFASTRGRAPVLNHLLRRARRGSFISMNYTTRLLRALVALPSVNPMGRDLPSEIIHEHRVTAYLESFFHDLGVPCERQTAAPGRENIVAHWTNSRAHRTLLFEAHQDTV